ncbi:MAG: hypothetical protein II943_11745 [Victivallales bacterium]|nr:hypothetical protein [Victivallales bacterium]
MKNLIPVITAVLLGLATVFAVSKATNKNTVEAKQNGKMIKVLVASETIKKGEMLDNKQFMAVDIPEAYFERLSNDLCKEEDQSLIQGKRSKRPITKGDYILVSYFDEDSELGKGKWGVPVTFSDSALLRMLKVGDEIAIAGTFTYTSRQSESKDENAEKKEVSRTVTMVLYPNETIQEIQGTTVLFAMEPEKAVKLTAIQRRVKLFPLKRRPNDDSFTNRTEISKFEDGNLMTEFAIEPDDETK